MSDIKKEGYQPADIEKRWYDFWMERGFFHAADSSEAEPYSIVIPPPNVTGSLHMGHALNNTLQDVLIRYHRMCGHNALWMPGTDHAGIATQNVVERDLAKEGKTRDDIGREAFIQRVWEWRKQYGGHILHQLRSLGCSCDWERERFTLDEGLSKAVREVFVRLYEEGLIYRGEALINWCPRCGTALSDIEVEHEDVKSSLWHIRYPLAEGDGALTVATTRPETMLGDTAVAVNPEDERYKDFIGKKVRLPLTERTIPVIGDSYVDMAFGTGALKITPAHDPNDFQIGKKHGLETIKVIDETGHITGGTKYDGQERFAARKAVEKDLEEGGYLVKIEDYQSAVGHCYRCKEIIEPNLSKQWFVSTKPLAEEAIAAVRDGRTRIIPETWTKTYFQWLENIRDWCISRQIWWGHRIPAWYCDKCGETIVAREDPTSCPKCGSEELRQDRDVLDTWFSSGLWPFSTFGWPDKTEALKTFYPTSCLITGFDILFFWVARMMMMGLKFMGEAPFADVYLHALVRDEHGKKMSKSKGNVIDPLDIIEEFGADAFRFTLTSMAAQGRDIALSRDRIAGYRRFANKIFQAARFSMMHLEGFDPDKVDEQAVNYSLPNKWILSRLATVTEQVTAAVEEYRFNDMANVIYQFFWHELCDWYIEMSKPVLYGEDEEAKTATRKTLYRTLDGALRLLHPIMPFISEELWQRLPGTGQSIMLAPFAIAKKEWKDEKAEKDVEYLIAVISAVRNRRGLLEIPPSKNVEAIIHAPQDRQREILAELKTHLLNLGKLDKLTVIESGEPPAQAAGMAVEDSQVFIPVADPDVLRNKLTSLEAGLGKLTDKLDQLAGRLNNPKFLERAPEEVVEEKREEQAALQLQIEQGRTNIDLIKEILAGS